MANLDYVRVWKKVIKNQNSWVLFENGTVVIFLPQMIFPETDLKAEAIQRLKNLQIREDVVVAELIGLGAGWIVYCGDDYILNYLPPMEVGKYRSRYDRMREMISVQKKDQRELKVIHIERK